MNGQTVELIDPSGAVVATAQVAESGDRFLGSIDLGPMPADLRSRFEEYEEVVSGQMFGLLDEAEERIAGLGIRAVFGADRIEAIEDLQVFPGTGRVAFKTVREAVPRN